MIYVGILFFSAFSKIKEEKSLVQREYDFFTDINFTINDYSMITSFKNFFVQELVAFINTSNGDVFGSYQFGSGIKDLIQSKSLEYNTVKNKLKGFIKDFAILYEEAFELDDINIDLNEYTLTIEIKVYLNKKHLVFKIIKNF